MFKDFEMIAVSGSGTSLLNSPERGDTSRGLLERTTIVLTPYSGPRMGGSADNRPGLPYSCDKSVTF